MKTLIIMRFSIHLQDGKDNFELAKQANPEDFSSFLFSEERLNRRFNIFEKICLPSLDKQSDTDFSLVILTSEALPAIYKIRLDNLAKKRSYITVIYFPALPTVDDAIFQALQILNIPNGELLSVQLDDDDALCYNYIEDLKETAFGVHHDDFVLTAPNGLYLRSNENSLEFANVWYPKVSVGLARFTRNWREMGTIYSLGNHYKISVEHLYHFRDDKISWIRSLHPDSDSKLVRDNFKKHVKKDAPIEIFTRQSTQLYPNFGLGSAEDIIQALYSARGTKVNVSKLTDKQSGPQTAKTNSSPSSKSSKDLASVPSKLLSKEAGEFITDIEPFLYDRAVTYVDVGANVGNVMKSLLESSIWVHKAHLIEPNPKVFAALEQAAEALSKTKRLKQLSCHNLAIGNTLGTLTMRDEGTMTHVVPLEPRTDGALPDDLFEIEAVTLDTLAEQNEIRHIDLLKVDVEGYEIAVFDGAQRLLDDQAIDVIYVEAGLDPGSPHQTYYRTIEDKLNGSGYRLFRIYEQKNEWIDDNPFLRRANLAFMSSRFAASNPYKISRKLFEARRNEQQLAAEAVDLREQTHVLSEKLEKRDQELLELRDKLSEANAKRKEHWKKVQSLTEINATLNASAEENASLQAKHVAQLASRDAKITDLTQQSEVREAALTTAKAQVKRQQKELVFLTEKLEAESGRATREVEKFKNSTSWRITAPIRLLKETMTPSKKNKRR